MIQESYFPSLIEFHVQGNTLRVRIFHVESEFLASLTCQQTLPAAIGNMGSLQFLDCKCNQLQCLPPEIGRLTALQRLDVSANRFVHI